MSTHPLGYEVGDKVYIFEHYAGSTRFTAGTVARITPTGQIAVTTKGHVRDLTRRFRPGGREVNGSTWSAPWLEKKSDQDARAKAVRAKMEERERQRSYNLRCQALIGLNLATQREQITAELHTLLAMVQS